MVPVMPPLSLSCEWASSSAILFVPGGSLFEPLIPYLSVSGSTIEVGRNARRLPTKGLCMFKSQQYRAKATECSELVKSSGSAEESHKFQDEDRVVSLADNEQGLADAYNNAVHVAEKDRSRGAALAAEEEHVLRCLGAAVIMQWNTLPTSLQREIFDTAGSVGKVLEPRRSAGRSHDFCTSTRMKPVAANSP